jgi:hypothetical protein
MTTFVRSTVTYDATTGNQTAVSTAVAGVAIRVANPYRNELARFEKGSATFQETAVLFWTPDAYGDRPRPGDVVTWEEVEWTAVFVDPIAPDGVTIAARVGVGR